MTGWPETWSVEEIDQARLASAGVDWRREFLQGWCPGPALVRRWGGFPSSTLHKLPCSLGAGHDGECEPKEGRVVWRDHDCERSGCEEPPPVREFDRDPATGLAKVMPIVSPTGARFV